MNDTLTTALKLMPTARALVALSEAQAQRDEAMLELKAFVEKYGARNSRTDQATIQDAHDLMVRLGAMCGGMEGKAALVWRHPGHPNQKVHGNRFGSYGAAKESLRRLKDDKAARERYKATARKAEKKPIKALNRTELNAEVSFGKTSKRRADAADELLRGKWKDDTVARKEADIPTVEEGWIPSVKDIGARGKITVFSETGLDGYQLAPVIRDRDGDYYTGSFGKVRKVKPDLAGK